MTDRLEAFANVYDEHLWDVYGFFGYRVSSREQVEDLVQTTFERALRAWHRFDPDRANARTWLLAIANNLLIDHYRRNSRRRLAGPEEPLPDADAGPAREMDELDALLGLDPELESALEGLGDRERELIALRYGGDLSGPEIAEITGLSLANVQQILSRALRRLHTELTEKGPANA